MGGMVTMRIPERLWWREMGWDGMGQKISTLAFRGLSAFASLCIPTHYTYAAFSV